MKLNIDCVRDLLLIIENEVNFTEDLKYPSVNINSLCESDFLKKYQKQDVCYAALKLKEGGFVDPNVISKRFHRALIKFTDKKIRFHDLRHYAASLYHALGVPDIYIIGIVKKSVVVKTH